MLIKSLEEIASFVAGDKTILKEVWHPKNDDIDLPYSLAHAYLEKGKASLVHQLNTAELYIFLSGTGKIHVGAETMEVQQGMTVLVPPNVNQYVENTGVDELRFYCIVSPPWSESGEEIKEAE